MPLIPGAWGPLISESLALAIVAAIVYVVQDFLFPLENYWLDLLSGLLAYTLAQWLLVRKHCLMNVFTALDQGKLRLVDTLLPFLGPLAISGALAMAGRGLFVFILPTVWMICILQTCTSAVVAHWLASLRLCAGVRLGGRAWKWLVSIGLAGLLYSLAFFSLDTKKPIHPLLSGDPAVKGVWFTIPVQKSGLFPAGYARLEDSVFDDLGRIFIAGLGQTLGLVEACEIPGPDITRSVPSPDPGALVQPKFNYAVDSMCPNWIATLPGFFWRIGLLGMFLLALIVGIGGFRDPIDFGILSLVLLVGWTTWPAPARERMGNVAVLIAGMPLIALIFPLFRRNRYSYLVMWGLLSGAMFGLAAFVRRPCGQALLITAIVILVFSALRQRRMLLAVTASLALLVGSSLVPAAVNGLFAYRDAKLQISAPRISPRVHGSGFPLLGGIGGRLIETPSGYTSQYGNSLNAAFIDAAIWYIVYDRNPMIGFTRKSFTLMQQTSQRVFVEYVARHPAEFALNLLRKGYDTLLLALNVPTNWPSVSLLLFGLLALRQVLSRRNPLGGSISGDRLKETVSGFIVLGLIAAMPAVLTSPNYGESAQLPSAVLFFAVIIALHYAFQAQVSRANCP